uniref:calpain-2 catalytic subunit-like n=1 Tax=Pristiophorus japonicus TaxID=55135 RepID=UPI00398E9571
MGNSDSRPGPGPGPLYLGPRAGSLEHPLPFRNQQFEAIRSHCQRSESLFEDPQFPAHQESLGKKKDLSIEWIRATRLFTNPRFFVQSVSTTDICQGELGNCWFLAAMSSLTLDAQLFSYVVPSDQSFQNLYAGIFRFRFWQYGKWVEVVVDDRLPTVHGNLIYTRSSSHNELWSALLEKAYAKLNGSYQSLVAGKVSEAMEDFTSGIAVCIELSSTTADELWPFVRRALNKQTLLSCSIKGSNTEEVEKDNGLGLMYAHAYAIMDVDTVKYGGSLVRLLRLRNPWGHREYSGPWADWSPTWKSVSKEEKARLKLKIKDDGEFWIPADIFVQSFSEMELCSLNPLCQHSTNCVWALTRHEGMWMSGITAGGKYGDGTFWINPQYRLTLLEEDDDPDDDEVSCTVTVELLQKYGRRKEKVEFHHIAFHIFPVPEQFHNQATHFGRKFFRYQKYVFSSGSYINSRAVARRLQLPPGQYIVVPSIFTKDEEGEFFLRIFAKKSNVSRENSITTSAFNTEIVLTKPNAASAEGTVLDRLKDAASLNSSLSASEFMKTFNSASPDRFHLTTGDLLQFGVCSE